MNWGDFIQAGSAQKFANGGVVMRGSLVNLYTPLRPGFFLPSGPPANQPLYILFDEWWDRWPRYIEA